MAVFYLFERNNGKRGNPITFARFEQRVDLGKNNTRYDALLAHQEDSPLLNKFRVDWSSEASAITVRITSGGRVSEVNAAFWQIQEVWL